jgi:hypothetical protein
MKLKYSVSYENDLTLPGDTPSGPAEQPYKCVRGKASCTKGKITIIKVSNPYPGKEIFIKPTLESRSWDNECVLWATDGEYITLHLRNQVSDDTVRFHLYVTTDFEDCQNVGS